jgi:hypothetical protein
MAKSYLSIAAIMRNEAYYIEEWLAFHQAVGVEHFYLYDNGSTDGSAEIAQWAAGDSVTIFDWPGRLRQLEAYGDALGRLRTESQWLAFIDLDEFLFCTRYLPLPTVLREFERVPAIGACWAMFGTSQQRSRKKSVLNSYRMRARRDDGRHRHVKSIVQPEWVPEHVPANPHVFRCQSYDTELRPLDGAFAETVTWSLLRVNHYWSKSMEEAVAKQKVPRADTGELRRGLLSSDLNAESDYAILPYVPLVDARRKWA